jgi:hypothetical protein
MLLKKPFVKSDKTIIKASHPPLDNLLIDCKGVLVKASPFKTTRDDLAYPVYSKTKKIIEQNNFVNQSPHTIGQQLDRIEENIDAHVSIKTAENQ